MLIDVRAKWQAHLQSQNLAPKDLLKDKIHLNDAGRDLMARLVGEELQRAPNLGNGVPSSDRIRQVGWDTLRRGADGGLELDFEGNRIVAVSNGKGAPNAEGALALVGRPLETIRDLWVATLPNPGPFIRMPAFKQIGFQQPPGAQKCMLSLLPNSSADGTKLHFKVDGAETGAEGEGWSDWRFVPPSGRVVMKPAEWHVAWPLSYRKKTLPEGLQVTWSMRETAAPRYQPAPADTRTVLVQGCANSEPVLRIQGDTGKLGIGSLVIHTPAGK